MIKQICGGAALVTLLTLPALPASLAPGALSAAEVIEQVLVRINGDILTKGEFEQRQVSALRGRPELANVTMESPELRTAIAEITPNLVLDAVDELLLVQRGRQLGIKMTDEQFNSVVANIKKQNNLEDEARWQAALKAEGMTLPELRTQMERGALIQQVLSRDVAGKISITDAEARAYYEGHKQEFSTPMTITLREILIEVPAAQGQVNVAADDDAKAEALSARNRLLGGEPFARLAGEISDAGSKANGGLIGPLNHDELAPALQKLLDGMKVGDISEPLRTDRGYQLLMLEERSEVKTQTFEEARAEIGNRVGEQKMAVERLKYLDKLRAEATIVWRNEELKKAYEQALEKRKAQEIRPQAS